MVIPRDEPPPTPDYLALVRTSPARLDAVMRRGATPAIDALVDWEWRGTNMPATSTVLGLRRFIKGFVRAGDQAIAGYNVSVAGADLRSPWTARRQRDGRREWAGFLTTAVDPTATDNRYLHALLLDYGAVPTPEPGIAAHLRDYVVRVARDSDELLLGRAFLAVGNRRIPVGWFALERLARIATRDEDYQV